MCDERLPEPPWVQDPSGWHSLDEVLPVDDFPLELCCWNCWRPLQVDPCAHCGQEQGQRRAVTTALPATSRVRSSSRMLEDSHPAADLRPRTHGELLLELARLRCAIAQAVLDIRTNIEGGTPGTGAALALSVLTRALEGSC